MSEINHIQRELKEIFCHFFFILKILPYAFAVCLHATFANESQLKTRVVLPMNFFSLAHSAILFSERTIIFFEFLAAVIASMVVL